MSHPLSGQQKRPAIRLFSGLVGSPLSWTAQFVEPTVSPTQTAETVSALIEDVAAAKTDEQVKQAFQNNLSPSPVKRGRGRPRKYEGATVQERDAKRKRVQRTRAKSKLAQLLRHFDLEVSSVIPPGLKTRYEIEVNTYRELLESEHVQTKVLKEITRDLKMIGKIPSPSPVNKETGLPLLSNGRYLTDAPSGKGLLTLSGDTAEIYDVREQQERGLSRPGDEDRFLDAFSSGGTLEDLPDSYLKSLLGIRDELPTGDRRKVRPEGDGPDRFELDRE